MKAILLLVLSSLILSLSAQDNNSDAVLTIGEEKVSKEDFLHGFYKNKTDDSSFVKEEMDEYLDLYINFKLKVKEAEALGLDTLKDFLKEYEGYKKQLTESYLIDKNVSELLIKEAYERMQEEVKASHILIELSPDAIPEDTLKAYNKILKLKERAEKGESFEDLAKQNSNDPSAKKNGGNLGYFSALKMVYPFETAAYNTKVGEISMPVRTRFGYHIIKVVDKRKSTGEWKVAHIMIRSGKDADSATLATNEKLINEIYLKVEAGEDFGNLARTYSDDTGTKRRGGILPWFRSNAYPETFETACFELENDGDYSKPFKTDYGFHIVKRLEVRENPSFEDSKSRIERKVSKDSRSKVTKQVTYKRLLKEYNFKDYSKNLKFVYPLVDSTFFTKEWAYETAKGKKKLFSLAGKTYTVSEFLVYLDKFNGRRKKGEFKVVTYKLYEQWKEQITFDYERSQLSVKFPEYARLLKEYKDGILLFDLMEQKVWNKAINDTSGLEKFFTQNQSNYMWEQRLVAEIYTCQDDSTASTVAELLADTTVSLPVLLDRINQNNVLKVRQKEGMYQKSDEEVLSMIDWKTGVSQSIPLNGKVYVIRVNQVRDVEPKKLNDSRGIVIADYQSYLDKEWIKVLRSKYQFKVNDAVYQSIVK